MTSCQPSVEVRSTLRIANPVFYLIVFAMLFGVLAPAQTAPPQPPKGTAPASAMDELPAQMQAVTSAQQAGDAAAIGAANRTLIAVGLRAMAELKLAQGDLTQAIDLYRRSIAIGDQPKAHIALALAYITAHRTDEALAQVEPITKSDPTNADAWNVQGKLLMDKKNYQAAAESLARSLELQSNPFVAYALASAFLNLHQDDKAQAIFQQLADAAGSNASVHIMIGRAYQNAGRTKDAAAEFNRAAELDAKGSRAHYFLGLLYLSENEWRATPQAHEEFAQEIKLNPNDFFGNFFLGYIDNADKLYEDSDRYLKIAAQDKPDWPEPYLYMGLNAFARNDNVKAEEMLRKAIQLTGDDTSRNNYQIRRAYYVLGRICFQTGRREEATKYTKIFSEMQDKTDALTRANSPANKTMGTMGSGMQSAPSVPSSAVLDPGSQSADSIPQLTPKQKTEIKEAEHRLSVVLGDAYNDLGTSEARQKKYAEALSNFQQAERWNPAIPHLMRNVGFAAFRAGQYTEAARALQAVHQQDPGEKMIVPMLAMSLFSSDQYAEAAKTFDQMGNAVYGDPRISYAYAVSLARSNQADKAKTVVGEISQGATTPEKELLLGQAYSEIGEPQKALTTFQKVLQDNPSLPRAHYYAGLAQLKAKQPTQAIAEFEAELKLTPDDAEAQYQLGKTLLEQGKASAALPHFEAAAKASPTPAGLHEQLAAAYRKLGRASDAEREAKLADAAKAPSTQPESN